MTDIKNIRHEYLLGDSLRLNQVLLNLLSNAGKFTPENGTITLTVKELPRKHSGHAVYQIAVADTGIGISPEFLPKLFLPFEREKSRYQNQTEGTGLGLVISKNIISVMGGQIFVESHLGGRVCIYRGGRASPFPWKRMTSCVTGLTLRIPGIFSKAGVFFWWRIMN